MHHKADTVKEYIDTLPHDRKEIICKLRDIVLANLPKGFEEQMSYGMIGYVVPLSLYPKGYHVNKDEPLPFLAIASQKNHVAIYHMGLYANLEIQQWFIKEYPNHAPTKLDMGKSCIRFRNLSLITYDLIAELCQKITVQEYIDMVEYATHAK